MKNRFERVYRSEGKSPASDGSGKKHYQPQPWETGGARSSKDAGKKATPGERAQSSQEQQNHHILINQEQMTNEIRPINEEASTSQHAPEHGREICQMGEICQMLDGLIDQYGNDPKQSPEIKKAAVKFLEEKLRGEKKYNKTKKLLDYAHAVDSCFSAERNSSLKEGIQNDILKGIYRLYRRKRLPEEMYGWRLTVWQWLTSWYVRPHPQE
jgi:hypothetical protein